MTPLSLSGHDVHLPAGVHAPNVHAPSWLHAPRAPWGSWWALDAALRWAGVPGLLILALIVAGIVWRIARRFRRAHQPMCTALTRDGQRCTRTADVGRRCWQHPVGQYPDYRDKPTPEAPVEQPSPGDGEPLTPEAQPKRAWASRDGEARDWMR